MSDVPLRQCSVLLNQLRTSFIQNLERKNKKKGKKRASLAITPRVTRARKKADKTVEKSSQPKQKKKVEIKLKKHYRSILLMSKNIQKIISNYKS